MIKIKSWADPWEKDDGVRVLIINPTENMKKQNIDTRKISNKWCPELEHYDFASKELAKILEMFGGGDSWASSKAIDMGWENFKDTYLKKIRVNKKANKEFMELRKQAETDNITLVCKNNNRDICFCTVLKNALEGQHGFWVG